MKLSQHFLEKAESCARLTSEPPMSQHATDTSAWKTLGAPWRSNRIGSSAGTTAYYGQIAYSDATIYRAPTPYTLSFAQPR
jgi:hypothetical protein